MNGTILLAVDASSGAGETVVDRIVSNLKAAGVTAEGLIREEKFGHISRAILKVADEYDVRMVVLGSSGRTDLPRVPGLAALASPGTLLPPGTPRDCCCARAVLPAGRHDDHRAGGVVHDLAADRAQHQPRESAAAP
jgi:hypothetical protein